MPLFRRRGREYDWAGPLAGEELDAFVRDVRADLDGRGWRYELVREGLRVSAPEQRELGLGNLAQTYHLAGPGEGATVVRVHFDNLLAADAFDVPGEFETARPLLRVRLVAPGFAANAPQLLVARELADDLVAVLAVDSPSAVVLLGQDTADGWGRDESELWSAGLAGVRAEGRPEALMHEADGARIATLTSDSFYTATWAMWAEELDPPPSEHGTLVAVPHRHALLAHAIRDVGALGAVRHLAAVADGLHREGPGSISPGVYWLRDGRFERLVIAVTEGNITFAPSDELMEVLNSLGDG